MKRIFSNYRLTYDWMGNRDIWQYYFSISGSPSQRGRQYDEAVKKSLREIESMGFPIPSYLYVDLWWKNDWYLEGKINVEKGLLPFI